MGLFGLIKTVGESVRADVKEWMGSDYFEAAVISGLGLFVEELTNAFMLASLKLTDWKALAYKTAHRLVFSGLYYFGGKSIGKPLEAVTASIIPISLIIVDGISYLMRGTPDQVGAKLAVSMGMWRPLAGASAGEQKVAKAVYVPSKPAPTKRIPNGLNIA